MPAPTPKNDQLAALREAQYQRRSAIRHAQSHQPAKPVTLAPVAEKIAKAKAAVDNAATVCKRCDTNRKATASRMRKLREKTT